MTEDRILKKVFETERKMPWMETVNRKDDSRRKKEHERKVRRKRSFGKTELIGKIWLIGSPHKSGNIRGRKKGKN
jgi:hypothetical protein